MASSTVLPWQASLRLVHFWVGNGIVLTSQISSGNQVLVPITCNKHLEIFSKQRTIFKDQLAANSFLGGLDSGSLVHLGIQTDIFLHTLSFVRHGRQCPRADLHCRRSAYLKTWISYSLEMDKLQNLSTWEFYSPKVFCFQCVFPRNLCRTNQQSYIASTVRSLSRANAYEPRHRVGWSNSQPKKRVLPLDHFPVFFVKLEGCIALFPTHVHENKPWNTVDQIILLHSKSKTHNRNLQQDQVETVPCPQGKANITYICCRHTVWYCTSPTHQQKHTIHKHYHKL